MIVVSNASPIMNLACVGQLELLQQLYGSVIIPGAVYREITVSGAGEAGAAEVQALEWIQVREVADRALATSLQIELDEGEAEAVALAVELKADLLLVDERRGRAVAARLGLTVIGLLGVLVEAKHQGYLPAIKPVLDALLVQAGFWVSQQLYSYVLQVAGE
jgi:predicted nucleic acid-binding protein